jgi:hypothetical protein
MMTKFEARSRKLPGGPQENNEKLQLKDLKVLVVLGLRREDMNRDHSYKKQKC